MEQTDTYKANPAYIASYNALLRTRVDDFLREKLRETGNDALSPSHGALLSIVYRNGGRAQVKTICETLRKGRPTVTEMINRLVRLGYLEKAACPEDGRVVYVIATEKAMKFKDDFGAISSELQTRILAGFDDDEATTLANLLEKAIGNFD